ncbi:MAG: aldose 1-epimerase family protein [Caldilineaceae bacterium]|nr:aldose 1-epimerase family protein [Caldilineaceae bacterium]
MPHFDMSRAAVTQHSVDMRQFVDFRLATLPAGMRVVDAYNASGLTFTVLPDRGLDIWLAAYNGQPLTWISQGAPHSPDFGSPWLRLFNGGLLVTCGLRHAGQPETDERTGEVRDLHGDFTRLRAGNLRVQAGWQDDRYVATLTGEVAEAMLFGEQLRLTRTYRMVLGEPWLEIEDVVENLYDTPAPLMLLYHFNFGYPLVQQGVQLYAANSAVLPRDHHAHSGLHAWPLYQSATPRHAEEVFFHQMVVGEDGTALAALAGPDFGVQLEWDTTHAPYLTQWKNYRPGIYVCGVEPGNCVPEGQNRARQTGRLAVLEPGEARRFHSRLTVLPDSDAVASMQRRVEALRTAGTPLPIDLADYKA